MMVARQIVSTVFMAISVMFLHVTVAFAGLNDGLVAYYPFNGNANDESGNGNHGIIQGATLTNDRYGNANRAYSFDGADDYILVPDNNSLDLSAISLLNKGRGKLFYSRILKINDIR